MTLLIWPIMLPFLAGIASLFAIRHLTSQRVLSLAFVAVYNFVAYRLLRRVLSDGIQVTQIGGWDAPYGISLVADRFSAIMIILVGIVGATTLIYSTVNIDRQRVAYGYYPLINILMMGVSGAFLTGDIFNLYVWFEVLLISSFVLLGLGGEVLQLQGTFKYVIINLVSSAVLLAAIGLLYGLTGTLNMANLAQVLSDAPPERQTLITSIAVLFMVAFGIKAAIFPFFFWMPAAYHTPPVAVSAFFAGLLTKVGVYSLVRVFTLLFVNDVAYTHSGLLLWLAGITMVTGVFGAMSQMEMRRILAFHSVSQVGYMIMGLALSALSPLALAGTIIYIVHHSIVKSNLFLISGVVRWLRGTAQLTQVSGLLTTRPMLALYFFVTAMSLAGIPPLSGFWAKYTLVLAGIEIGQYWITAAALFTGVWTLYSMTKIWSYVFWRKPIETGELPIDYSRRELVGHLLPVLMLMALTVLIGIVAEPAIEFAYLTAEQLLDQQAYINAVQPVVDVSRR